MPDANKFNDVGSNTLKHIVISNKGLNAPNLIKLGLGDFLNGELSKVNHPNSITAILKETSKGKDTMTGHWEMMGINTTKPFQTFTDTGFPDSLIKELEEKTGYKFIGNYAASGTQIIADLGEQHMKDKSLILYTSSDSVLQIAALEDIVPIKELYHVCDIAREICMKPEYFVGRIIARPFIGKDKTCFVRDKAGRHDIAVNPSGVTALDILKENKILTLGIGKIGDIFNQVGITTSIKTKSNNDGMIKTINELKTNNKEGLYFVNLVEFDSEYGHRRNPVGYAKCIEDFDIQLKEFLENMKEDDLLIITADHGNDPTFKGTDHTREKVPFIAYSKLIKNGKMISERDSFADIGDSILYNFDLNKSKSMLGNYIKEIF